MSSFAILFTITLLMITESGVSEELSSYEKEVLGACKTEVKDHCHDKTLKGEEIATCLKEKSQNQKNTFSDNCRDSLAKKK